MQRVRSVSLAPLYRSLATSSTGAAAAVAEKRMLAKYTSLDHAIPSLQLP